MKKAVNLAALLLLVVSIAACTGASQKKCVPAGCGGQLCVEPGAITTSTCDANNSYRCYQTKGICERQPDGKCGWTPTDALSACLTRTNSRPPFLPDSFLQQ